MHPLRTGQHNAFLKTLDARYKKRTGACVGRRRLRKAHSWNQFAPQGWQLRISQPYRWWKTFNNLASPAIGPNRVLGKDQGVITIARDGINERISTDCSEYAPLPANVSRARATALGDHADKVTAGTQ